MARKRGRLLARVSSKEQNTAYRRLKTQIVDVNRMLRALNKSFTEPTYAQEQLIQKLTTKNANIYNKKTKSIALKGVKLNKTQIRTISNALESFKSSKTSTVRGVKNIVRVQRSELLRRSGNADWVNQLTDDEVSDLHSAFSDKDFEKAMYNLASDVAYQLLIDAKETVANNVDDKSDEELFDDFLLEIQLFSNEDADISRRKKIKNIYNKYVK